MKPTIKALREQKATLEDQLKVVNSAITEKLSQTVVRCENIDCLRGWEIRELTYIDQQTCEEECGYGGSYRVWHEEQWICPKCTYLNRLNNKPEINELKDCFGSKEIKTR
jgi:hypothetical protein